VKLAGRGVRRAGTGRYRTKRVLVAFAGAAVAIVAGGIVLVTHRTL
jgi:hypothetical protein